MKQGWEIKKLGEVIQKTETIDPTKLPDKVFQYVDVSSVNNINFCIEKGTILQGKDAPSRARKLIKTNDVIFATVRPTLKRIAIVEKELDQQVCSTGYFVFRTKEILNNRLLFYFLLSDNFNRDMEKLQKGASYPAVTDGEVRDQIISFPKSLQEQQHIVAILDEAFASIGKAKAIAEQNLKNGKDLFESYLESIFENKSDEWEEKALGEVIQKTETVDPTKKPDKSFIYIDVSSVNNKRFEIELTSLVKGKDAPNRARKLIKTNDVIFATVRPTLKRVAIIADEYNEQVCSTGYIVLRAKDIINYRFIFYFLLTDRFLSQMDKLQKGASYPAVTDSDVKCQIIPFPKSLIEQRSIVQKLDALSEETKKLETIYQQKLNNLEELKKSILQKAFNGELEIKQAGAE